MEVEPQLPWLVREGLSIRLGTLDLPLNYWGRHWTDVYGLSGSNFIFPTYKLLPWETGESLSVNLRNDPVAPIWPRNPTARRGNQAVTLHWDPPYLNGGSAITRYEYRYRTSGEFPATWTAVPDGSDADTNAGNERNVRVSGLTNGTTYRFEVRAVNSAGAGPEWGGAAATPNAPPTSVDRTVTTPEDRLYLFTHSDWGFSDEDAGDSLQWVILESPPPAESGTTYISRRGRGPIFIPTRNWNGNTHLKFRVSDGKDESRIHTITINVTPVNDPATGKPTISGTRQAGQILTASTAGIADVDGVPDSFTYQWLRVDSDGASNPFTISGETSSTYTLTAEDVGKRARVQVIFTDEDGTSEELTSNATGTVQAQGTANAAPTAFDATVVTEEDTDYVFQTADFGFADTNTGDVLVSVKAVTLPTAGTLLLGGAALTAGATVSAGDITTGKFAFRPSPNANGAPYASFTFKVSDGTADSTSANTITTNVTPVNDPPTGKLKFVRDPKNTWVGISTEEIADADGMTNATFFYQRHRRFSDIIYEVVDKYNIAWYSHDAHLDSGFEISWKVSYTDDDGTRETIHSDWNLLFPAGMQVDAPHITATPSISEAGEDKVWSPGETVEIRLTFNERMTVLAYDGMPSIGLELGGTQARRARYHIGNSTDTLVFRYTLSQADGPHNAMVVPPNSLALNGGVIRSRENRLDAALTHDGAAVITQSQQQTSNTPATGTPGIDGSPLPGQTLTANTSGIQDQDGMTGAVFVYQWIQHDLTTTTDTDIAGATGSTYTVTAQDEGKAIKVRVTFIDEAGNAESLTSYAALASQSQIFLDRDVSNTPATGAPGIDGSPVVGQTLTATTSNIGDDDGITNAVFTYQWMADDAPAANATSSTYTVAALDEGKALKVRVIFTDDAGNAESLTSAATASVTRPLTADIYRAPASHDGQSVFTFRLHFSAEPKQSFGYRTLQDHAFTVTGGDITGVRRLEPNKNVRWEISVRPSVTTDATVSLPITTDCASQGAVCTDDGRMLSSALELVIPGPSSQQSSQENSAATGAPAITGTTQVGETLTAATTDIADTDGVTNAVFAYQWLADVTLIENATSSTYTIAAADVGKTLKVKVTFIDDAGNAESLTSAPTAAVTVRPNSPATGTPTITGTAQVGETLTAATTDISDDDGITNAVFAHQWLAGDVAINSATASTYTVAAADEGKALKVKVSFTDDAGNVETLTSAATAAVTVRPNSPATGTPTITGTAQVDETLTGSTSGIADTEGLTNVSYNYQWIRNDGDADADIQGATVSTYTLVAADEGKTVKVQVSFTPTTLAMTRASPARPQAPCQRRPQR